MGKFNISFDLLFGTTLTLPWETIVTSHKHEFSAISLRHMDEIQASLFWDK